MIFDTIYIMFAMICVGKLFLFFSLEGNEVIPYRLFVLS
jgi:hypothetical protein